MRSILVGKVAASNVIRGRRAASDVLGEPGMHFIPAGFRKKRRSRSMVVALSGHAWIDAAGRVLAARYDLDRIRRITVCPP